MSKAAAAVKTNPKTKDSESKESKNEETKAANLEVLIPTTPEVEMEPKEESKKLSKKDEARALKDQLKSLRAEVKAEKQAEEDALDPKAKSALIMRRLLRRAEKLAMKHEFRKVEGVLNQLVAENNYAVTLK